MVPHCDPLVAIPGGEVSGFSQKAPQGVAAFFRVETRETVMMNRITATVGAVALQRRRVSTRQ